jgi:hypothetical protein
MPVRNFCATTRVRAAHSARLRSRDESGDPHQFVYQSCQSFRGGLGRPVKCHDSQLANLEDASMQLRSSHKPDAAPARTTHRARAASERRA